MTIRKVFLLVLALAYIGLGLFLYIRNNPESASYNLPIALLFFIYGCWRFYRAIKLEDTEV